MAKRNALFLISFSFMKTPPTVSPSAAQTKRYPFYADYFAMTLMSCAAPATNAATAPTIEPTAKERFSATFPPNRVITELTVSFIMQKEGDNKKNTPEAINAAAAINDKSLPPLPSAPATANKTPATARIYVSRFINENLNISTSPITGNFSEYPKAICKPV